MAHAISLPRRDALEHRGLSHWMQRTVEELAKFRSQADADVVHDLRVAIRRSRSVAAAVAEIDPHRDWLEMRAVGRKLFRAMGGLRDTQVAAQWLKELQPREDPLKSRLLESLAAAESAALKKAIRHSERFDQQRWSELRLALCKRLRIIPLNSDAAKCLALERLEEAKELHRRALRTEKPAPWHQLRIGVKRFRYTVESLLPALYEQHSESLKRIQDVLGDIHDLDVVWALTRSDQLETDEPQRAEWDDRISAARQDRLQTYRQLSLGSASVWQSWMSFFPRDGWKRYASARIAATRRALDPDLQRTQAVTRVARSLWKHVVDVNDNGGDRDPNEWRVLSAAARLSGIRLISGKKSQGKAARDFLLRMPVPPGWTFAEWEQVSWTIRFQKGSAPGEKNHRFGNLSIEQQAKIMRLAGILRIALVLAKFGVIAGAAVTVETMSGGLLIQVRDMQDTPENAARFTKAKGMLERSLGKTILLRAVAPAATLPPSPASPTAAQTMFVVR